MSACPNCRSPATTSRSQEKKGASNAMWLMPNKLSQAGSESCTSPLAGGQHELYLSLHQHSSCCRLKHGMQGM